MPRKLRMDDYTIVDDVTPDAMAGNSQLEKLLNSIITRNFIGTKGLPDNECLSEAREILNMRIDYLRDSIAAYLYSQFCTFTIIRNKGQPCNEPYTPPVKRAQQNREHCLRVAEEIEGVIMRLR